MSAPAQPSDLDREFLKQAIELARRCPASQTAFSVGAVIVRDGKVISTGYSREEDPHEHAEETAIRRALAAGHVLEGCDIYSSLEPCAKRVSGRRTCCDRIRDAGFARVVFASVEPPIFVPGRGAEMLRESGIDVVQIEALAGWVREVNSHLDWTASGA